MYLIAPAVGGDWPVTRGRYFEALADWEYIRGVLIAAAGLVFLQGLMLLPVAKPRPTEHRGMSAKVSYAVAIACAVLLGFGFLACAADLLWYCTTATTGYGQGLPRSFPALVAVGVGLSWLIGSVLFWKLSRGKRHEDVLSRFAFRLFAGTVVEVAMSIPIQVLVRKRESCFCQTGTYWAMITGFGIGLIALGPAVLLPLLVKRRRWWWRDRCGACGYDMSGSSGRDRCPECGADWAAPPRESECGTG